jgi:BirA family transcriptional regulator, biotin operon repressor / biotin---[acetyl-CoA-carboxylase] ligase
MTLRSHPAVQAAVRRARHLTVHQHHASVTSTNDVALEAVGAGVPLGLVVTADRQTAGRGRHGRSWTDDVAGPEGPGNLAVSVVVALPDHSPGLTPLAAGLAVHAAYAAAGASPTLKWPNDVLLDGRKAAGILVERHALAEREVVVVGCGLDLDWRGVARVGDAAGWTSLAESLGVGIDRGQVLADLLLALDGELAALEDPAALLARYRERCSTLGRDVDVTLPGGGVLAGRAVDLDGDGLLVVDTGRERIAVRAGEIAVRSSR